MKQISTIARIALKCGRLGWLDFINDELYLSLIYRLVFKRKLNWKNPQRFNEKLQWLKVNYRDPVFTKLVDKYEVKKIVSEILGEEYVIPAYGIYNKFDDIDFDSLPNQFVIKCTHDSGGIFICKDKNCFDIDKARKKIDYHLKRNSTHFGREWPYSNVEPRILIEKYMEDESKTQLKDYKVFTFSGEPKIIQLDFDRFEGHKKKLYDLDWNEIDIEFHYPNDKNVSFEKPAQLDEILDLAKKLSFGLPFLRTDFYIVDGQIYFGELTFFPASGFGIFSDEKFDVLLGSWIDLSKRFN